MKCEAFMNECVNNLYWNTNHILWNGAEFGAGGPAEAHGPPSMGPWEQEPDGLKYVEPSEPGKATDKKEKGLIQQVLKQSRWLVRQLKLHVEVHVIMYRSQVCPEKEVCNCQAFAFSFQRSGWVLQTGQSLVRMLGELSPFWNYKFLISPATRCRFSISVLSAAHMSLWGIDLPAVTRF